MITALQASRKARYLRMLERKTTQLLLAARELQERVEEERKKMQQTCPHPKEHVINGRTVNTCILCGFQATYLETKS